MKTIPVLILIIILFGTLLPQSASCQWFYRQYGVENISELTQDEREFALKSAAKKSKTGGILTTIGGLGIISGYIIVRAGALNFLVSTLASEHSVSQGLSSMLFGSSLFIVGAISGVVGIPIWISGAKRKSDIKKAIGNTISKIYLSPNIGWYQNKSFTGVKITLLLNQ